MAFTKNKEREKARVLVGGSIQYPKSVYQKICIAGAFSVGVLIVRKTLYSRYSESRHIKILLLSRRGVVIHYCRSEGVADVVKPPVNASPGPKKKDYSKASEQKEKSNIQIG
jgi:hypothetical protein